MPELSAEPASASTLPDIDLTGEAISGMPGVADDRQVIQPDIVLNEERESALEPGVDNAGSDAQMLDALVPIEPVTSEPVASGPVASEPVASEPVASEPVTSEPVTSEPSVLRPAAMSISPGDVRDAPAIPTPPRPLGMLGRLWRRVQGYVKRAAKTVLKPLRRRS